MNKLDKIKELKALLDSNAITDEEYDRLKIEAIDNEESKSNLQFRTKSINWLAFISVIGIFVFHFISFITIKSEVSGQVLNHSQSLAANTSINFIQTNYGIISLSLTLITFIGILFRFRWSWVGGIAVTICVIMTFLLSSSYGGSYSASNAYASANAKAYIIYSPGFFYILFCVFLLVISAFNIQKSEEKIIREPLSLRLKVFAGIGLLGSSLSLLEFLLYYLDEQNFQDARELFLVVINGVIPDSWETSEGFFSFLNENQIMTSWWCSHIGLLYGFSIMIIVSQIFILFKRRIFIYIFILPLCITAFTKIILFNEFVAGRSEYFGYILRIFWDVEDYSETLHTIGSLIFYYLLPIVFFVIYFLERKKMTYA